VDLRILSHIEKRYWITILKKKYRMIEIDKKEEEKPGTDIQDVLRSIS
jgi:hypothetical protein